MSELMEFGVDRTGFEVFERERDAAMKQKKPVMVFATEPEYLTTMADMAQLLPPYREQFEALLVAHHQPLRETGK